jgi:hypothetical protein
VRHSRYGFPFGPIAVIALVATSAGCQQILGLHERPERAEAADANGVGVASTVSQCGALPQPSESCASCMDQHCCAQAQACAAIPACEEASDCLANCSDATCMAQCNLFYTLPTTLVALRACRVQNCASSCGSSCGEFVSGNSSCESCLATSCCSQGATCAANTACAQLNLCVSNCFEAVSCPAACDTEFADGSADYATWYGCTGQQCASACQPGTNWSCLTGSNLWPQPPAEAKITFSVTFVDFSTEEPFVGSAVKACDKLDYSCSSPIDRSTTDATGLVTLSVPPGLAGFDGYLDVTGGELAGTASDAGSDAGAGAPVFPAIWYPVPYVVADGWRGRTVLVAQDEFAQLAMATGTSPDATRGQVALNAADCLFTPAAGVSFSLDSADSQTVSYYLIGGVPVTSAKATDGSGIGAFLNVPTSAPARLVVASAFSTAAGKSMGSLTFVVRPGTFTTSSLFPPLPQP